MVRELANIEFRVPYSQRYLFNAIPDTNHNANPTNRNTRYRCEYGTLNSMFSHESMQLGVQEPATSHARACLLR